MNPLLRALARGRRWRPPQAVPESAGLGESRRGRESRERSQDRNIGETEHRLRGSPKAKQRRGGWKWTPSGGSVAWVCCACFLNARDDTLFHTHGK